jgi:hypothetical protein
MRKGKQQYLSWNKLLIQSTGQDKWTETIVENKTLLLQTIIDVAAVADELNINQKTFKEIQLIELKVCFSLDIVVFLFSLRAGHLNRKCSIFSCSIWHSSHFCSSFSFENLCLLMHCQLNLETRYQFEHSGKMD